MNGSVLIFIEQRSGRVHPASLQLFGVARKLAGEAGAEPGGGIIAVTLGHEVSALGETLARYGAERVLLVDDPALAQYRAQPYTAALCTVIEKTKPRVVLMATTSLGRDLAPRVAVRTGAALATDCVDLEYEDGALHVRRTMYCGKCFARVRLDADRVQIVSIRPNSFTAEESPSSAAPSELVPLELDDSDQVATVLDIVRTAGEVKDVTEADIVVSGGRSLKSEENFKIIEELAEAFDGAVGASRAAVDAGYQPHSRQVGLTGKIVTPKLYIACGIDGAIQHLAGMRGSKVIVAINTKRDAPIFGVATYGIVADLFDMVPLLTEEVRRLKGSQ